LKTKSLQVSNPFALKNYYFFLLFLLKRDKGDYNISSLNAHTKWKDFISLAS